MRFCAGLLSSSFLCFTVLNRTSTCALLPGMGPNSRLAASSSQATAHSLKLASGCVTTIISISAGGCGGAHVTSKPPRRQHDAACSALDAPFWAWPALLVSFALDPPPSPTIGACQHHPTEVSSLQASAIGFARLLCSVWWFGPDQPFTSSFAPLSPPLFPHTRCQPLHFEVSLARASRPGSARLLSCAWASPLPSPSPANQPLF